jgi:RimJ/RimL family protein N-acetyltransferase
MDHFTTNRLSAEKLREDHLADLVELHLDPEVARYLGGVRSPEKTRAYVADNMAHWDRHGFGLWILRTKAGEFAGRAGIRPVTVDNVEEIEIAYTFKRTLWGQGLASETAKALTGIGLSHFQLPSLIGLISAENVASRRVLEKLNYALERRATHKDEEVVLYRLSGPFEMR